MQKLLKRTAQAQRQAARRAKERMQREANHENRNSRRGIQEAFAELRGNIRAARLAVKEDWELGPIAPKRDLGFNGYGTIRSRMREQWSAQGFNGVQSELAQKRCAWAGGTKQLNLAPGDRVVILHGPDRGKIDRIESIDTSMGYVKLEKYHQSVLVIPEMKLKGTAVSMPLPVSSIRLVHPITDPQTGITRDVIINELKAIPPNMKSDHMTYERWQFGAKWDRLVPGVNVVIPWPKVEVPDLSATEADTLREEVNERTFHYSLLSPPLPEPVLDELRNKYSRFRTRHEAWYLEKKVAEDEAKKGRHELLKFMQTPLDEFHAKQRELRAEQGEPELTDEMLSKIGEIMARNKPAGQTLHASDVASTQTPLQ